MSAWEGRRRGASVFVLGLLVNKFDAGAWGQQPRGKEKYWVYLYTFASVQYYKIGYDYISHDKREKVSLLSRIGLSPWIGALLDDHPDHGHRLKIHLLMSSLAINGN